MNETILQRIKKFDFIKRSLNTPNTPFSMFGVECDEGWDDIIFNLCEKLDFVKFRGVVIQVKEKFGGLRFYVNGATNADNALISDAEIAASKTCEVCGKPGKIFDNHKWLKTVCEEHERW